MCFLIGSQGLFKVTRICDKSLPNRGTRQLLLDALQLLVESIQLLLQSYESQVYYLIHIPCHTNADSSHIIYGTLLLSSASSELSCDLINSASKESGFSARCPLCIFTNVIAKVAMEAMKCLQISRGTERVHPLC